MLRRHDRQHGSHHRSGHRSHHGSQQGSYRSATIWSASTISLLLVGSAMLLAGCSSGGTTATGATAASSTTAPTTGGRGSGSGEPGGASSSTAGATSPAGTTTVIPYFLRNGQVAAGERRPTSGDAHVEAVNVLAAGPNETEKAAGLSSAVPDNTVVKKLTVQDGVATIDLSRTFETRETQPQVAQVVFALTQFPEITKVKFLIEGQDNGATGVPAVGREQFAKYTPDVLLESPWPGQSSGSSLKVSGDIDPAYSSFTYRLQTAFGQELSTGTINAKFGTGRKKFDQAVELPANTSGGATFVFEPPTGSKMPAFAVSFSVGP